MKKARQKKNKKILGANNIKMMCSKSFIAIIIYFFGLFHPQIINAGEVIEVRKKFLIFLNFIGGEDE